MPSRQVEDNKQALHQSEQRYRMLLEYAAVGIFIADIKGQIIFVNSAGCALLGYTEQALLQMRLMDIIAAEDLKQNPLQLEKLQAEKRVSLERQLRRNDGTLITVEIDSKMLPDGSLQGIVTDITSRKKMELRLKASETRFRSLVEQSPLSTVIYHTNGNMLMFNQASCDLWRLSNEEAEYLLANYNIFQDERLEAQGLMPYVKQGFAGKMTTIPMLEYFPEQQDITNSDPPPATQWVRGFIYPVKDDEGNVHEVVIIHEDVTERQQIEERLRQAQKQESLGVLAGGVAHDFNNLLVAILGQISLAQARLPVDSPARTHIKKAITAAEHAADLTRQLLAYSGKGRFEITAVDLNSLIQQNLHLLEVSVPKRVSLKLKPAQSLPLVDGDIGQMQQLIMNLIINAAEAIGERPGTVSIATAVQTFRTVNPRLWQYTGKVLAPGRYVKITVSDDGEGMDSDTLSQIFDPFFTTKSTGRGLGLAAVLGIVRGQSGGLTIDSQPGQGTTFQVYFPASQTNGAAQKADQTDYTAQPLKQAGVVLVIDDEKAVREAVVDILAFEGLEAITAVNGETGIALYREREAEVLLVLLDLSMPGLNGIETLKQLKQINPQVKVLLSSGYSREELNQQINTTDIAGFLQKPYSTHHLTRIIRSQLT